MNRDQAEQVLLKTFRFEKFFDNQWMVIEKILRGERVLLIEKTGFGKSLCFQFPATLFDGTAVIFSPLIALMRDQVQKLRAVGIAANCINSNQSEEENTKIIEAALQGQLCILYIAPERMENAEWLSSTHQMKISMVVIDEAHCISVWGHDFRPSYRRIIHLVNELPLNFPVLATTATATPQVQEDILKQIGKNISLVRGNLLRENLELNIIHTRSEDEKMMWLGRYLEKFEGTGIIYCGTRASTDIYTQWFNFLGINAVAYHGGLESTERQDIEQGLINNSYKCVVSTNALGMGIDKPDIRFIIHTQTPASPIHYYQEIGRAGRDGKPSKIALFYNPAADLDLPKAFIESGRPDISKYRKVIRVIKSERLTEPEIMKAVNLKQTQLRVILADLIDQGIIVKIEETQKRKLYEYRFDAEEIDVRTFEKFRKIRMNDLDQMEKYIDTKDCRMKFLCSYLGDNCASNCMRCDNDKGVRHTVQVTPQWTSKLEEFRNTCFPVLAVAKGSLVDGVAASYYGFSSVGQTIHKCKYNKGGDFPDSLVELALKAFDKYYGQEEFDWVLHVPPTESGDLVKNFAGKIAARLNIPISHNLVKTKDTHAQKIYESGVLKKKNVRDAFDYQPADEISDKKILLIDDVFDSGHTIKEIGRILTIFGAVKVAPLVIAKTIGNIYESVD